MKLPFIVATVLAMVPACSGRLNPETVTPGSDASTPLGHDAGVDVVVPEATTSTVCGSDLLCVNVNVDQLGASVPSYSVDKVRFAVVWIPMNDSDKSLRAEVVHRPSGGGWQLDSAGRLTIPMAEITKPTNESLATCNRVCDGPTCPCDSTRPTVYYGLVVSFYDVNGSGVFDPYDRTSLNPNPPLDTMPQAVVLSASASYCASNKDCLAQTTFPTSTQPNWFEILPQGVAKGIHVYDLVRVNGGNFDRPVPRTSSAAIAFTTHLCTAFSIGGNICTPTAPNLY